MTIHLARSFALLATPVLLLGGRPQQPAQTAAAAQPYVYTGTVHRVQVKTGSLDLITGVGHAFRMIHMSVSPQTQMVSGAAAIQLSALVPGDRLQATCRKTDRGLVADRFEKLPPPDPNP